MQTKFSKVEGSLLEHIGSGDEKSWYYDKADTKYNNHGLHGYPAMMIPQIAHRLMKIYGKDKETILDPFMGSGTTLLESKIDFSFKKAIGIDINPLAVLISRSKTTPINPKLLYEEYHNIIQDFHRVNRNIEKPDFFNISFWFKENVIEDLSKLKEAIYKIIDEDIKNFFKVIFSNIIRKVSNTRNGEFKLYKMPEKSLENFNPSVFEEFSMECEKSINKMKKFYSVSNICKISILNEDSRDKTSIDSNSVDLIVTSPPYGDSKTTVAYGQYSRLSLQWMDFDKKIYSSIDKDSLGGIPVKNIEDEILQTNQLNKIITKIQKVDEKRAKDVLSFYIDFYKCIKEFDRVLKEKSVLCFVVGNRRVNNHVIPTDEIIVELFKNYNSYEHEKTIIRNIPNKKMPKQNSPTNKKGEKSSTMNNEYIVILNKK
ncbi:MAG: site-specific DNA-methyltransferase [Methanobrevibacter sp.]|jgi:DNA modification methylase|nr:site-specific DNA-methyltransferase [Candidatus Methanovirga meridionalis]